MPFYKKKPAIVEARKMPLGPGNNAEAFDVYWWVESEWGGSFDFNSDERPAKGVTIDPSTGFMNIATLEGLMQVKPGDYVIKGVQGEFYPCKPDIFESTYDQIDILQEVTEHRMTINDARKLMGHPRFEETDDSDHSDL